MARAESRGSAQHQRHTTTKTILQLQTLTTLLLVVGLLTSIGCKTAAPLPAQIQLHTPRTSIQLVFLGKDRDLEISMPGKDWKFEVGERDIKYRKLELIIVHGQAVGMLIEHRMLWWGDYSCTMAGLPETLRNRPTSVIMVANPAVCVDATHTHERLTRYVLLVDGKPADDLEPIWERCIRLDPRFEILRF